MANYRRFYRLEVTNLQGKVTSTHEYSESSFAELRRQLVHMIGVDSNSVEIAMHITAMRPGTSYDLIRLKAAFGKEDQITWTARLTLICAPLN